MTVLELWQNTWIRLNKVESPALYIEPFNRILNEAIWAVCNDVYDSFNIDQERTDAIPELNTYVELNITGSLASPVTLAGDIADVYETTPIIIEDTTYGRKFILPDNYWHLTSVLITFTSTRNQICYTANSRPIYTAKRLSRDMEAAIQNNAYLRPRFDRPYYIIYRNPAPNINREASNKVRGVNNSTIEIRTGDHPTFTISNIRVTYLKQPEYLFLTYEAAFSNDIIPGSILDTTQVLEFPNHICNVVLDKVVERIRLITNDPALNVDVPFNQSVSPLKPRQQ